MNEQSKHGDEWELLHLALVLKKKLNNYSLFLTFSFLYFTYYNKIYQFKIYQSKQFLPMFHQQLQWHL